MACADCCSNNYCKYCNACANCHNNYTIVQNYLQAVRYNWHNKNLGSPKLSFHGDIFIESMFEVLLMLPVDEMVLMTDGILGKLAADKFKSRHQSLVMKKIPKD